MKYFSKKEWTMAYDTDHGSQCMMYVRMKIEAILRSTEQNPQTNQKNENDENEYDRSVRENQTKKPNIDQNRWKKRYRYGR